MIFTFLHIRPSQKKCAHGYKESLSMQGGHKLTVLNMLKMTVFISVYRIC